MENIKKPKTKVDLVTGFLGAGKTTFIKGYASYLKRRGISFVVIENEFGFAGVDAAGLKAEGIAAKELAGGCICCSLKVNFHDALLQLSADYERIIVEPSGIFNPGDFFSVMESPSVKSACGYGCMLTVFDLNPPKNLTAAAKEVLIAELNGTGAVIASKGQGADGGIPALIRKELTGLLSDTVPAGFIRGVSEKAYPVPLMSLADKDYASLMRSAPAAIELQAGTTDHEGIFQSCTFYPQKIFSRQQVSAVCEAFKDMDTVLRVKGYLLADNGAMWLVDYTPGGGTALRSKADSSKAMINVIGGKLDRNAIKKLLI